MGCLVNNVAINNNPVNSSTMNSIENSTANISIEEKREEVVQCGGCVVAEGGAMVGDGEEERRKWLLPGRERSWVGLLP